MYRLTKYNRILDIYIRLCEGKVISKSEEAERFGVNERSIQRDIDEIRAILDERAVNGKENRTVIYDRSKKGFVISESEGSMLDNNEILAVSKILLASRAFTKKEITTILDKIVLGCVPLKNTKLVSELIANEKYHYVQPRHSTKVTKKLWQIGEHIRDRDYIEIVYFRQGGNSKNTTARIVEPLAVIFSEYYFYLLSYTIKVDECGKYKRTHDYPTIFRLDRITDFKAVGDRFSISYANRFEEGLFRKRIQFMYAGDLLSLKLRYTGASVEAILDKLPTAEIISECNNEWLIKAEVYGRGIFMWLLSQGDMIEVLEPVELRQQMREKILKMSSLYSE
ncbi:MAG: WYL domain-containing protein [Ruminococcus sp.]|nr:WYL domain-containing protein [Ruminococcus sp.]